MNKVYNWLLENAQTIVIIGGILTILGGYLSYKNSEKESLKNEALIQQNIKLADTILSKAQGIQQQNLQLQHPISDNFSANFVFELDYIAFTNNIDNILSSTKLRSRLATENDKMSKLPHWDFPSEVFNNFQDKILAGFSTLSVTIDFFDSTSQETILTLSGKGEIDNIPVKTHPVSNSQLENDISSVISYLARDNKLMYNVEKKKFELTVNVPLKIKSKKITTSSLFNLTRTKVEITTNYGMLHLNLDKDPERLRAIQLNTHVQIIEPDNLVLRYFRLKMDKSVLVNRNDLIVDNYKFVIQKL